jgi:redox-sensitive bicupin YhaK (pirin superfamily)
MSIRAVKRLTKSKPTLEGAGVHLRRAFGFGNTSDFDPFLLLDDFRNDIPEDYLAGFPWHPHRGIETITYVLAGTVEHGDSMGNRGAIAAGDVQWMTAGSGIIHQEMPKGDQAGRMHGFQSWANLPSSLKMTSPRCQEVKAVDIPEMTDDDGTQIRIVCGTFGGKQAQSTELPLSPFIWMCRFRRDGGRLFQWRRLVTPLRTYSQGVGSFVTRPALWLCPRKALAGRIRRLPRRPTIVPSYFSTEVTSWKCRRERTESGFCWSLESH